MTITPRQWREVWQAVAMEQFANFAAAGDGEAALRIWQRQQQLTAARAMLARSLANGDSAAYAELVGAPKNSEAA